MTIPAVAGEPLISLAPPEETNALLRNPDMGWVVYENYPLDQNPQGSSTMLRLPEETFPEVDAVAVMFSWRDVETSRGVYDFSKVDRSYDYWSKRGKEIQLRMSSEPLMCAPRQASEPDAGAPVYVLDQLTASEKQTRRMAGIPYEVADSRNQFYRDRLSAFLRAVNDHYGTGRPVKLIDLRGFGAWGEWHSGFKYADLATRRTALKGILDLWTRALPQHLLALSYSYDPDGPKALYAGSNEKFEAVRTTNYAEFLRYSAFDYALTRKNITFRRDGCGGAVHSNERRLNEEAFQKFHRAPMFGEFLGAYSSVKQGGSNWVSWMVDDALSQHPNYLNLIGWQAEDARDFARERSDLIARGSLQMGYRLVPTRVQYPATVKRNASFKMRLEWVNRGVGRALHDYELKLLLVNPDGSEAAESLPKTLPTSQWLKGATYAITPRFTFPIANPGEYRLAIALRDPASQRPIAMPLRAKGSEGSYDIGVLRVREE